MAIFTCLAMLLVGKKKKNMVSSKSQSNDGLARTESAGDVAYEGSDEHDEIQSMKRDYSEFDLQCKGEFVSQGSNTDLNKFASDNKMESNEGSTPETMFATGHVSDPGMEPSVFSESPVLKRSCSNIEIKSANKSMNSSKRSSYNELKNLSRKDIGQFTCEASNSPLSVKTSCSADYVIPNKHSSCHVLPSRCSKIWWKLFLWSHMNLQKPIAPQKLAFALNDANPKFGYSSDTYELVKKLDKQKKSMETDNQWFVFSLQSSPQDRVYDWVNSLDDCTFCPIDDEETCGGKEDEWTGSPHYMEIGESSRKNHCQTTLRAVAEEVTQDNNIIQSLNSFSSVAHISGMGLKVIPSISAFGNLRSVSLSGNFIAHVTPGCLPKHIHSLDLSQNKISAIEGLRDLTRLRVLNLSYNRISRIGHGLSNCTVIKELNLAGNKISDVEGLHRLLKLTVLDLSFNKITTTKAFGQLVANYNSLLSLNLIGNSIQRNMGEDQIRKAVVSLLPRISYFNKQPIKQHRLREVGANIVAKAAVGDGGWSSRRRPTRRIAHGSGSTTKSKVGEGSSNGRKNQSFNKHQLSSFVRK